MKKYIKILKEKLLVMAVSIVLLPLAFAPRADALTMTLDDLSTVGIDVIVVDDADGGIGTLTTMGLSNFSDFLPGDGLLGFNGSVGSFFVNVTTGVSQPIIGDSDNARIDLNSINVSNAAGTLQIMLTDVDFSALNYQDIGGVYLTNTFGGTTDGYVTAQGYLDPGNAEFGMGGFTTGFQGPIGPGAFADTVSIVTAAFPGLSPFSLTEIVTIFHDSFGDITSFDKLLAAQPVPEPATMLLLGIGLLALAGVGKKNRVLDLITTRRFSAVPKKSGSDLKHRSN